MKHGTKWFATLFTLLLVLLVLPVTGFAAQETVQMAPAPEPPQRFAAPTTYATGSFEDYVDTEAFMSYLLGQMKNCAAKIDISAYGIPASGDYLSQIGYYIIRNYPEMFHFTWFGPYYYSGNVITEISVTYNAFSDTTAEFNTCTNEFEAVVDRLVDGIEGNSWLSETDKALLLHDRLVAWTEYDLARLDNGTIPDMSYTAYGILVKQLGVCQGYALAYDYLLERVGVRCEYVSSELLNHAWNIVYINNKPYHVDTTWDDSPWDMTGLVNHDNFLRSSNGIKATGHEENGVVDYDTTPTDTTYDNYYWQRSNTAFQYVGGWIFYIDNVSQMLRYIDAQGYGVDLVDVTANWYSTNGGIWDANFARLSSDKTTLFFSKPDGIYRYHPFEPNAGTVEKVFSPNLSIGNTFSVFGFKYERGYLICDLTNTPNYDQYTKNNQVRYQFAVEYDDGWQLIGSKWYYYANNTPKTGWLKDGNSWYYLDTNGAMVTGTVIIGGKQHQFNSSGVWLGEVQQNGWVSAGGKWYYYRNGAKVTGWLKDGSTWYYLNGQGVMQTGWLKVGSTWYYLNGQGVMQTGWLKLGNTWYYLKSNGAMVTGTVNIGGKNHVFSSSGIWQGEAQTNGWVQSGGYWYYYRNGAKATGWQQIGGKWYYMNSSGIMQTGWVKDGYTWYYMSGSGAMHTGWLKIGSTWYYMNSSGAMHTGWLYLGGKWYAFTASGSMITGWGYDEYGNYYYFNSDGSMVTGRKYIDGYWYTFNSNGVCQNL